MSNDKIVPFNHMAWEFYLSKDSIKGASSLMHASSDLEGVTESHAPAKNQS